MLTIWVKYKTKEKSMFLSFNMHATYTLKSNIGNGNETLKNFQNLILKIKQSDNWHAKENNDVSTIKVTWSQWFH